jgi:hypothetical protein
LGDFGGPTHLRPPAALALVLTGLPVATSRTAGSNTRSGSHPVGVIGRA